MHRIDRTDTVQCNCESIVCTHEGSAKGECCKQRAPAGGNKIMYIGSVCSGCYRAYGEEYQLPKERGHCQYAMHEQDCGENRGDHYLYPVPGAKWKACERCRDYLASEVMRKEMEAREREVRRQTAHPCSYCEAAFADARDLRAHVSLRHSSITGAIRWGR